MSIKHIQAVRMIQDLWDQDTYAKDIPAILDEMVDSPVKYFYMARFRLEALRDGYNKVNPDSYKYEVDEKERTQTAFDEMHKRELKEITQLFERSRTYNYGAEFEWEQAYVNLLYSMSCENGATVAPMDDNRFFAVKDEVYPYLQELAEKGFGPAAYMAVSMAVDKADMKSAAQYRVMAEKNGYLNGKIGADYLSHLSGNISLAVPKPYQFPENFDQNSVVQTLVDAVKGGSVEAIAYAQNYLDAADGARRTLEEVEYYQKKNESLPEGKKVNEVQLNIAREMVRVGEQLKNVLIAQGVIEEHYQVTKTSSTTGIETRAYPPNPTFSLLPKVHEIIEEQRAECALTIIYEATRNIIRESERKVRALTETEDQDQANSLRQLIGDGREESLKKLLREIDEYMKGDELLTKAKAIEYMQRLRRMSKDLKETLSSPDDSYGIAVSRIVNTATREVKPFLFERPKPSSIVKKITGSLVAISGANTEENFPELPVELKKKTDSTVKPVIVISPIEKLEEGEEGQAWLDRIINPALQKLQKDESKTSQDFYRKVEHDMVIRGDRRDGIKTTFEIITIEYPDGSSTEMPAYVRDATKPMPLDKRLSPDHPIIEADNMLLRVLGTLRGVDHVIAIQIRELAGNEEAEDFYSTLITERAALMKAYVELMRKINDFKEGELTNKDIKKLHEEFNSQLIRSLHRLNLDEGIKPTVDGYRELLLYFRYMASVIDPAPAIRTTFNTQFQGRSVRHVETSIPITEKTVEQKGQLSEMENINTNPSKDERNYHTSRPKAFQVINSTFVGEIKNDGHRLPSKMRSYIPPSVKNGYLMHYEITPYGRSKSDMWQSRSGTVAYTGEGESYESIQKATQDNLEQLKGYAQKVKGKNVELHYTILNTNSSQERQHIMMEHTKEATRKKQWRYSSVPTNPLGQMGPRLEVEENVARTVDKKGGAVPHLFIPGRRMQYASQVGFTAGRKQKGMNHTTCAHGRDRTGTVCELIWQKFAEMFLQKTLEEGETLSKKSSQKKRTMTKQGEVHRESSESIKKGIIEGRASAGIAPFTASLELPGSPGMNPDSRPGDLFGKAINKQFYRNSAYTVKTEKASSAPIDQTVLSELVEIKESDFIKEQKLLSSVMKDLQTALNHAVAMLQAKHGVLEEKRESGDLEDDTNNPEYKLVQSMLGKEDGEPFNKESNNFVLLQQEIRDAQADSTMPLSRDTVRECVQKFADITAESENMLQKSDYFEDYTNWQKFVDLLKNALASLFQKADVPVLSTGGIVTSIGKSSATLFSKREKNSEITVLGIQSTKPISSH